jgi:hypothetical protein
MLMRMERPAQVPPTAEPHAPFVSRSVTVPGSGGEAPESEPRAK